MSSAEQHSTERTPSVRHAATKAAASSDARLARVAPTGASHASPTRNSTAGTAARPCLELFTSAAPTRDSRTAFAIKRSKGTSFSSGSGSAENCDSQNLAFVCMRPGASARRSQPTAASRTGQRTCSAFPVSLLKSSCATSCLLSALESLAELSPICPRRAPGPSRKGALSWAGPSRLLRVLSSSDVTPRARAVVLLALASPREGSRLYRLYHHTGVVLRRLHQVRASVAVLASRRGLLAPRRKASRQHVAPRGCDGRKRGHPAPRRRRRA